MPCLEVAVNGERHCVAGTDRVTMLVASVALGWLGDATDRHWTALSVHGMSEDLDPQYYWGKKDLALKTGDVITIRVVDEVVADDPIPVPTPPDIIKAHERLMERLSTLEQHTRSNLIGLSIWLALLVGTLALWWFLAP